MYRNFHFGRRFSRFFKYKKIKLTEKIIRVYNKLGYSFREKVYENSMMIEFKREEIPAASQSLIQ